MNIKTNFERIKQHNIQIGDRFKHKKSGNIVTIEHIHSIYGWVISDGFPLISQTLENINDFDKLEWYETIRSKEYPVYDSAEARKLYDDKAYTARQLSVMKQINIKHWLDNAEFNSDDFYRLFAPVCGYCFEYMSAQHCERCPIFKKCGTYCVILKKYKDMAKAIKSHKAFCEKIGFKEVYKEVKK